jgi:release factor glutamine methyltransferase
VLQQQPTAGAQVRWRPGGWLLLEHGSTQGAAVRERCAAVLREVQTWRDLAGCERVTGGRLPA